MKVSSKSYVFVGVQIVCAVVILLTGKIIVSGMVNWMLLTLSGLIALWAFAKVKLHERLMFPEPAEGSALITTGPYRWIRHPMYTSLLLLLAVLVIHDYSHFRLAVWVVLAADMLLKIRYEERLLVEMFADYPGYMMKTKRLIPFMY